MPKGRVAEGQDSFRDEEHLSRPRHVGDNVSNMSFDGAGQVELGMSEDEKGAGYGRGSISDDSPSRGGETGLGLDLTGLGLGMKSPPILRRSLAVDPSLTVLSVHSTQYSVLRT